MLANTRNGWLTPAVDQPPSPPHGRVETLKRSVWAAGQGVLIFIAFQIYKMVRRYGIPDDPAIAYDHARDIIHVQDRLGLYFEPTWQSWALNRDDSYIRFFNYVYAYYMWWVIGGLSLLALLAPVRYRFLRRAFTISMLLVTPMYLIYPLAPPRFLDDFVDTMAVYGPNYFSESGLVQANRYAAMPSMHVGWTTFVAIAVGMLLPSPRLRVLLVVFMASLITYVVIITGNHYWLDAVVGWVFVGAAIVINHYLPYPLLRREHSVAEPTTSDARS